MILKAKHIFPKVIFLVCLGLSLSFSINTAASQQNAVSENVSGTSDPSIFLPVALKNYDRSLGIPIFGTQMYGSTHESSQFHDALMESNASWLRNQVNWSSVEPVRTNPVSYNWNSVDSALAAAREDMGGVHIIGTFEHVPDWAGPEHGPIPQHRFDEFAQFVQAAVERYDGDGFNDAPGSPVVLYWEFFNEPDRNEWWGTKDKAPEFANMLQQVYPAVKSANPNAQVVFPGIAYDWFEDQNGAFYRNFLTDVLNHGGGNYFDVMNFHAYPAFHINWTQNEGPGLLEKANAIRSVLNSYGLDKPMIVTEAGWYSNNVIGGNIPGSPQIQARYVVELFTQSLAADLDVMIWWMLYDLEGYHHDNGLVTSSNPPANKLSYTTYTILVDKLSTAHFVRKFSNAETGDPRMEVYQFEDFVNQRLVYVAWMNPVTTSTTKSLRISASQGIVRSAVTGNFIKNVADAEDGLTDGRITVTVSASPIYVEVAK